MKTPVRKRPKSNASVAAPTIKRRRGTAVLSVRLSLEAMKNMRTELAKLGIIEKHDVQDFCRGALVAGVTNAARAKSPQWKRFLAAIQKLAHAHLGMGLDLDDAEGLKHAGRATRY